MWPGIVGESAMVLAIMSLLHAPCRIPAESAIRTKNCHQLNVIASFSLGDSTAGDWFRSEVIMMLCAHRKLHITICPIVLPLIFIATSELVALGENASDGRLGDVMRLHMRCKSPEEM